MENSQMCALPCRSNQDMCLTWEWRAGEVFHSVFAQRAHGDDEDDEEQSYEPSCHLIIVRHPNALVICCILQEPPFPNMLLPASCRLSRHTAGRGQWGGGFVVPNLCSAAALLLFSVELQPAGVPAALSVPGTWQLLPFFAY